jgi:hypothetical protein
MPPTIVKASASLPKGYSRTVVGGEAKAVFRRSGAGEILKGGGSFAKKSASIGVLEWLESLGCFNKCGVARLRNLVTIKKPGRRLRIAGQST